MLELLPEVVSEDDVPPDDEPVPIPELPEVPELSVLPVPDELVPLVPEEPELPEALPPAGVSVVVVVVVTLGELPELPEEGLAPDVAAPDFEGSVVVVVVVVCPNVIVAVPISDRKMAIGNFFMLAPAWLDSKDLGR